MQNPKLPTIHIISDSVGVTAHSVARAAAAQFGITEPYVETLSKAVSFTEICAYIDSKVAQLSGGDESEKVLVFYTLVDQELRSQVAAYTARHPRVVAVDLIGDAIDAIASVSGLSPRDVPGGLRVADHQYFKRIAAMEFTINHDDGRNPHELTQADIVLLGVSRSGKTPTSVYLSQQGFKVANVPLDPDTEPPVELYDVEPSRLFGLITTPEVLVSIRRRRLGNAAGVASNYADTEEVYRDLEQARAFMRKLGCIVLPTDNRAVEETAQEILRYYDLAHGQNNF